MMLEAFQRSFDRTPPGHDALVSIIHGVRRRWRLKIALRGSAIVGAAAVLLFLVSSFGMDRLHFTPTAVLVFQLLAYGTLFALTVKFLVLPLLRRVSDDRVALYLEEHEPSLAGEVLSAVEFGAAPTPDRSRLVQRLVERAVTRCAAIDDGRWVERPELTRSSGVLAGVTLVGLAVLLLNPAFVRHGAPFLLAPWAGGGERSPYAIDVAPGDVTLARGADLKVSAILRNFDSDNVELVLQRGGEDWERWPMTVDEDSGEYLILVFEMADAASYFVEASGVRSPVYRVTVTDLPYVQRIDLEYHFPRYTGLAPRRDEDGGDIAALAGTRVDLSIMPTIPVSGGALIVNQGDTIALEPTAEGLWNARLTLRESGYYRVMLRAPTGALVNASPEYVIDVLTDQPPFVSFRRPGRDMTATNVDEVFTEVAAEDDFGVVGVELVYSVNGSAPRTVPLHRGGRPLKEVTAGHTMYLEEFDLQPGDFISYYARATDARATGGSQVGTTDIYFLEIRPFDRRYRQADQAGGGGGDGPNPGELSQRQREIVAGTFKVVRDSAQYASSEYRDHLTTLALAQGRLREEVTTLLRRLQTRGVVGADSTLRIVAEALPHAVAAMEQAEEELGRRDPRTALGPEQRALQHLQRAEAVFREREVAQGGGNPGGGAASAEELAELFDLELDRMRNQYEQVQRGRRQETDQQLDEVLEKLKELARRQQQENERLRAQAQRRGEPSGGGAAGGQRRLAEEAEELARRLERLAREQSRPDLAESARRLQEAAEQMRRAASAPNGSAQGGAALDELREARRQLEQNRSAGLRREAEDALRRAERLLEQQRDVRENVQRLPESGAAREEELRRLVERKNDMAAEIGELEAQLDRLGRESRQEQPEASRQLRDAATSIRNERLEDKIRYSRGVVQGRSREYARNFEEQIESDLAELRDRIAEALNDIGETREQRLGRSLDRTRDLANAMESMSERLRQQAERGQEGEQQQGQQGQPAQQGQRGEGGNRGLDRRQLQRELAERGAELERLRREFGREGFDTGPLNDLLNRLGRMDNREAAGDPRGLAELAEQLAQGLKQFEYAVRRGLGEDDPRERFLAGSGDVPPEYRPLVEQYYKSLSDRRP